MPARFLRFAPVLAAATLLALSGCATAPESADTTPRRAPSAPATHAPPAPKSSTAPRPQERPTTRHRAPEGQVHASAVPRLPASTTASHSSNALPLSYPTGSATQLITVTASDMSTTEATLQTWTRKGSSWVKLDAPVHAWVGSQGLTNAMSEFVSATPVGSFTLTQAFGRLSNPGTPLPYFKTSPEDWWISQTGPKYNTHQRCTDDNGDGCGYQAPSEHLYYETPYYNYALVIDYNTRNAGKVVQNGGSAVFLYVTVGEPTAGCVAIPQEEMVRILRWLKPSAHPRILIGVA